ncbi:MAG: 4-(cytidine 5'-diphospho)-2-C-methyl-D-erythritol kinase [Ruminococcaceae bacterium]|nr:4-(cytidine 5'-diphospho)-2-C-methyl-D-erythritol kinase [Oscillospiraceae bacterium]
MRCLTVTVPANAKINLYLDVIGRRENGFHEIESVMQTLSLADTLSATRSGEDITLDTSGVLPTDDTNLVVRAAKAYFAAAGERFGVHLRLQKIIPMAAGMGGGSADAAATLKALNMLNNDRFSPDQLAAIGATVGADVPFLVFGGTALCRGIGEVITPLTNRVAASVVVAVDGEGVSTPWAFSALDKCYNGFVDFKSERTATPLIKALEEGDVSSTVKALFNRFEAVVEPQRPAISDLKRELYRYGAAAVQMSGSGPAVFGIFDDEAAAQRATNYLKNCGVRAYHCKML